MQKKQHNIFNNTENIKLRKEVNRFNRKLKRLLKKYENENIMLPNLLSTTQIKQEIKYKNDLNNLYRSINRFMTRGSEKIITLKSGLKMTNYQKHELELQMRRSRRNIEKQIDILETKKDELGLKNYNKSMKYQEYKFLTDEVERLKANKESLYGLNKKKNKEQVKNLIKRIDKYSSKSRIEQRNQIYKENYIETIKHVFGYEEGVEDFIKFLEDIDVNDFYSMIAYDDIASNIKTIYKEGYSISQNKSLYSEDEYLDRIKNAWYKKLGDKNERN